MTTLQVPEKYQLVPGSFDVAKAIGATDICEAYIVDQKKRTIFFADQISDQAQQNLLKLGFSIVPDHH